ncbi:MULTISPECIES: helix-turn-helix domain-containing protein [Mycobacteriaceae]|uniref:Helix-turn-helix domain-containing protein n=1 Tax=Mycolicibacterium neoaurum VKM Ac-1815D TaxID=700508 RepID=V5XIG7_MYCNE|nr:MULTISPECIES: helix-turn-helix domain-containing protein [Mycobacteriaceae]AHC27822.1 hypothetical protein D174_04220 [Mycolicibacterium neoaurum VKM Ac-1815D]AMO04512.1 hypothetical protein MyAD_04135 [Mycolicibacterium neoaurum]AXK77199.1 DNA-binding protein [Mycolicibacterium neoaurum]KJQ48535.1 hypothetical protein TS71_20715 [Mycolicibacterium neoaurum]KUM06922.1 hypothetical protein AVZ31_18885 [Mycolicibacterium neoaurum]
MRFTDDDIAALLYCVTELVDRRARSGVNIPAWMLKLSARLDLTSALSARDHKLQSVGAALESEIGNSFVGTREAAKLLGLTEASVRRLATDLDGQKVGRDWVFKLSTVLQYAEERSNGRHR